MAADQICDSAPDPANGNCPFQLWVGKLFNGGLGDWNAFYTLPNDAGALYKATDVIDTYVFRSLKKINDYGMSAAVGLYQSVIGFALVLLSNMVIKKIDPDSALF